MYQFNPLIKNTLWGCEHWMISGVKGHETTVFGGPADGLSLSQLVAQQKETLLGKENFRRYGTEFPLLIKFIDARQDLSIQVHPNDEMAQKRGFPRGKTEMWYLMDSDSHARLRSGLKQKITPQQYKQLVADGNITDALAEYSVKEGDCFFLPAGRIHSIGAGCRLAEIQQTSDVTYRIYDFKRRDKDGHERQLHTEEAAECIDYQVYDDYRTHYRHSINEKIELVNCPYFHTSLYELDGVKQLDYSSIDSFVILMVTDGTLTLTVDDGCDNDSDNDNDNQGNGCVVNKGGTVLLPATTSSMVMSGQAKVLEVYVP